MISDQDFQRMANAVTAANATARIATDAAQAAQGKVAQLEAIVQRNATDFANVLSRVQVQQRVGDPNIQRVENIPGRRIPFDLLTDIIIPAGSQATQQGSITITQEGPFVAVARFASFISAYQFQYTPPGSTTATRFNGRSFGRYRPIHSVWDMNDGQPVNSVSYAQAFPGTGAPHIMSPSNESSFRSMEMDFRILMREAGSSFPRSNQEVPSSMWMKGLSDPFNLGALDFFERGEVIQFNILPMHIPNPAYGNISGFAAGFTDFPFLDSQWDAIEGINDQAQDNDNNGTDPIVRVPNGILTIGYHGYRIIQPAGAGQY
jgi:hypothetical protein